VHELDRRVGPRRGSAFVTAAVERALADERRWELVESSLGSVADGGREWDLDPASWVQAQRRVTAARVIGGRLATGNPADFPMPEIIVDHWRAGA
jgi:hypothetical protein